MKTYSKVRRAEERQEQISALGWQSYETPNYQLRMKKGNIDVCIRAFGRFEAYNIDTGENIGNHMSSNLEGEEWYDEVLEIIYES